MLEGIASASLDVLQATALVAFVMCFIVMVVFIVLAAMASPLALAAKAMVKQKKGVAKDTVVWLFTWLALYGLYLFWTGGA